MKKTNKQKMLNSIQSVIRQMKPDFKEVIEQSNKAKLLKKGKAVRVKSKIIPFTRTMHGTVLKTDKGNKLAKNK